MKLFATCVATLMLIKKGGGAHSCLRGVGEPGNFPLSRFVLFIVFFFLVYVISNCRFVLYPFFFRAYVYGGHVLFNISAF